MLSHKIAPTNTGTSTHYYRPSSTWLAYALNSANSQGGDMLILTRREGETIQIDDKIRVTILGQKNGQIKVGIEAPKEVPIVREELLKQD